MKPVYKHIYSDTAIKLTLYTRPMMVPPRTDATPLP